MRGRNIVMGAMLMIAALGAYGCGRAATDAPTPIPVQPTEGATATATPEIIAPTATSPPPPTATVEPVEPSPTLVATETPSPTETPEPAEPTPSATRGPEPTAEPDEPEGQVLLEERCTVCHTLERVRRSEKSRDEWVTTVERMVSWGAQLSDAEMETLIDYLVQSYGP